MTPLAPLVAHYLITVPMYLGIGMKEESCQHDARIGGDRSLDSLPTCNTGMCVEAGERAAGYSLCSGNHVLRAMHAPRE